MGASIGKFTDDIFRWNSDVYKNKSYSDAERSTHRRKALAMFSQHSFFQIDFLEYELHMNLHVPESPEDPVFDVMKDPSIKAIQLQLIRHRDEEYGGSSRCSTLIVSGILHASNKTATCTVHKIPRFDNNEASMRKSDAFCANEAAWGKIMTCMLDMIGLYLQTDVNENKFSTWDLTQLAEAFRDRVQTINRIPIYILGQEMDISSWRGRSPLTSSPGLKRLFAGPIYLHEFVPSPSDKNPHKMAYVQKMITFTPPEQEFILYVLSLIGVFTLQSFTLRDGFIHSATEASWNQLMKNTRWPKWHWTHKVFANVKKLIPMLRSYMFSFFHNNDLFNLMKSPSFSTDDVAVECITKNVSMGLKHGDLDAWEKHMDFERPLQTFEESSGESGREQLQALERQAPQVSQCRYLFMLTVTNKAAQAILDLDLHALETALGNTTAADFIGLHSLEYYGDYGNTNSNFVLTLDLLQVVIDVEKDSIDFADLVSTKLLMVKTLLRHGVQLNALWVTFTWDMKISKSNLLGLSTTFLTRWDRKYPLDRLSHRNLHAARELLVQWGAVTTPAAFLQPHRYVNQEQIKTWLNQPPSRQNDCMHIDPNDKAQFPAHGIFQVYEGQFIDHPPKHELQYYPPSAFSYVPYPRNTDVTVCGVPGLAKIMDSKKDKDGSVTYDVMPKALEASLTGIPLPDTISVSYDQIQVDYNALIGEQIVITNPKHPAFSQFATVKEVNFDSHMGKHVFTCIGLDLSPIQNATRDEFECVPIPAGSLVTCGPQMHYGIVVAAHVSQESTHMFEYDIVPFEMWNYETMITTYHFTTKDLTIAPFPDHVTVQIASNTDAVCEKYAGFEGSVIRLVEDAVTTTQGHFYEVELHTRNDGSMMEPETLFHVPTSCLVLED